MHLEQQYIFYFIIYLIIPLIFIFRWKNNNLYLNKDNTENMKAIAITIIVIHHFSQKLENTGLLTPFKGFGYLGVSIFFFLSGFGLMVSYMNKENYLSNFFTKRMSKVYIPFVLVNIIQLIFSYFISNTRYDLSNIICYIFGIKLISCELWYILIILLWYVLFYISFKYFEKSTGEKILYVVAIAYFLLSWRFGLSKNWYDTSFIFPIGVSFCLRKDKIINIMNKYYLALLGSSFALFGVTFVLNHEKTAIQFIIIRALSSIFFVLLINLFLLKVDTSNNKALAFIGSISFEIYLVHNRLPIFQTLSNGDNINGFHLIIYFGIVIAVSMGLNRVNMYINRIINNVHKGKHFSN
jgi:membrane-bound acyltransferase YfiQ involved in biofilm formation